MMEILILVMGVMKIACWNFVVMEPFRRGRIVTITIRKTVMVVAQIAKKNVVETENWMTVNNVMTAITLI